VTSLLLGIAQGEGLVGPVSTPVMDAYPELSRVVTPDKRTITLEHLLTMTSGLAWREGEGLLTDEDRLAWRKDVPRFVLSRPGAEPPGTRFHYCGGNTALLADLLVRASGMPFREYARVKLFEPLGIRDWEWVGDLHGRPLAFAGLRMRPRDLLKVGRLVLNNGAWGGRQVVPKAWIRTSLEPRFRTGVSDFSYGYQWWTGTVAWHGKALPWKAAFGNGGQRLFLVPDLDLAVVTTAGAYDQMPTARRVNAFLAEVVATVRP
jgi:CubicO group peptidase (beta-lactamase class C family)